MTKVTRRGIIYPRSLGCLPWVGTLELRCVLGLQLGLLLLHTREATRATSICWVSTMCPGFPIQCFIASTQGYYSWHFLFVKKGNWVWGRLSNSSNVNRKVAEPGLEWNLSDSDIWSFSMRTPLSTCEGRLETPSFRQHKLRTLGFTGVKKKIPASFPHLINTTNVRWLEINSSWTIRAFFFSFNFYWTQVFWQNAKSKFSVSTQYLHRWEWKQRWYRCFTR